METPMSWAEAWIRTRGAHLLPKLRGQRQPANAISEQAVLIGVVATLGLAAAVAFMSGLGQILTREVQRIGAQVP
jgi:hypothetical protein